MFSGKRVFSLIALLGLSLLSANGSHIDNENGELSNFSYDKVVYRVKKDCSLDRMPGVSFLKFVMSF